MLGLGGRVFGLANSGFRKVATPGTTMEANGRVCLESQKVAILQDLTPPYFRRYHLHSKRDVFVDVGSHLVPNNLSVDFCALPL